MRISDILIVKIREFEGCRLTAYRCPAGYLTIGVGHTKGVKPGMVITQQQADTLLRGDLLPCEKYVNSLGLSLTQGQFDALVDFCFNLGADALGRSTLLKKIIAKAPAKDIRDEFAKWVHAKGKRLPGLVKRREWEASHWQ